MTVQVVSHGFMRQLSTNNGTTGPVSVSCPPNSLIVAAVVGTGSNPNTTLLSRFAGTPFQGSGLGFVTGDFALRMDIAACPVRFAQTSAPLDYTPAAGATSASGYYWVLSGARHATGTGWVGSNNTSDLSSAETLSVPALTPTVTGSRYFACTAILRNSTVALTDETTDFLSTGGVAFCGAFGHRATTNTVGDSGVTYSMTRSTGTSGAATGCVLALEVLPQSGPYAAWGWGAAA